MIISDVSASCQNSASLAALSKPQSEEAKLVNEFFASNIACALPRELNIFVCRRELCTLTCPPERQMISEFVNAVCYFLWKSLLL